MDVEKKPRRLRIISGSALEVETQVNLMLDEYAPMSWLFNAVGDRLVVTCLMVLESEVRKAQLATMQPMQMRKS